MLQGQTIERYSSIKQQNVQQQHRCNFKPDSLTAHNEALLMWTIEHNQASREWETFSAIIPFHIQK